MKQLNLPKTATFLIITLVFILSSCRKSDVQFLEKSEEWKIESMEIRTRDQTTGAVLTDETKVFEFFRMKKYTEEIININGYLIKYSGNQFELETYVDSSYQTESKTYKINYWSGDPLKVKNVEGVYVAPHDQVDLGGATSIDCFLMAFNSNENQWNLQMFTQAVMTVRKLNKDKMKVNILDIGGQYRETSLILTK
jgi:hypothetical protein